MFGDQNVAFPSGDTLTAVASVVLTVSAYEWHKKKKKICGRIEGSRRLGIPNRNCYPSNLIPIKLPSQPPIARKSLFEIVYKSQAGAFVTTEE